MDKRAAYALAMTAVVLGAAMLGNETREAAEAAQKAVETAETGSAARTAGAPMATEIRQAVRAQKYQNARGLLMESALYFAERIMHDTTTAGSVASAEQLQRYLSALMEC